MSDEDNRPGPGRRLVRPTFDEEEFPPSSALVGVEFGARSHAGHRRAENDDHYWIVRIGRHLETLMTSLPEGSWPDRFDESGFGMVVADGMGGAGSERASRLAIATLAHLGMQYGRWNVRVNEGTAWEIAQQAEWFYHQVDETVTAAAHTHPSLAVMGTTLTATYSAGDELFVVHVGHSRAYLFRAGQLTRLTRDQTFAQRVAETGRAAPTELAARDLRHILTDAIGGHAVGADIQIEMFRLVDNDLVMLCTNGLTDLVDDHHIAALLKSPRPADELCQALVDQALQHGGTDNVTVLLGKYRIPGPDAAPSPR
jgi:PPM family protein phosphatase